MAIASFDVGMKNLAYAVIDSERSILYWNTHDISPARGEDVCVCLVKLLDTLPFLLHDVETVIIEKQPSKNNKMRIIESLLYAYFIIKGASSEDSSVKKAVIYSAKYKLGAESFRGKSSYAERKKLSVLRCSKFIESQSESMQTLFNGSKKKDDLADSLLQGLAYMKAPELTALSELKFSYEEKIVSRKPSKKQNKYGFSKSNLKWTYTHEASKFETCPKVISACKKWYGSVDEALNALKSKRS